MRRVLTEELNYLSSEVDMIEPQIASVVIERGLARPAAGMPASWKKTNVAKAVKRKREGDGGGLDIFKFFSNLIGSFFNKTKRIIPVAIAAIYLVQSGSLGKIKNIYFQKLIPKRQPVTRSLPVAEAIVVKRPKPPTSTVTPPFPQKSVKAITPLKSVKAITPPKAFKANTPTKSFKGKIDVNTMHSVRATTWLEKIL